MSEAIDLDYRPEGYFKPGSIEQELLAKIGNAALREQVKECVDAGRWDLVWALVGDEAATEARARALEAVHPQFMGGNYLPEPEEGEVELARISIASTTQDVTSVLARREAGKIRYRVVDEYGGDTLQGPERAVTDVPMTLGEFHDFFMRAWPLLEVLESNFEDDLAGALGFFSVESDFYPDLGRLCAVRAIDLFKGRRGRDRNRP